MTPLRGQSAADPPEVESTFVWAKMLMRIDQLQHKILGLFEFEIAVLFAA